MTKGTLPIFHHAWIYKNVIAIVSYIDSAITIELFLILQYQKTYSVGFSKVVSKLKRRNVSSNTASASTFISKHLYAHRCLTIGTHDRGVE